MQKDGDYMKKRSIIIFDVIISIVVILGLCLNAKSINREFNLRQSEMLSGNEDLNFDVSVTPERQKVLAGSTVKIKVDTKNIDMGELRNK